VLLAWEAARACPLAERVLDLGSGKGTVALLLLHRLPRCRVVGVEALVSSHELAIRNAALNGLEDRYAPLLGDLRDPSVLGDEAAFDLVTGAPPFMPVGSGVLPKDPQRAAGRFELRGGVREYARTAARHLAPGGKVVLLMDGLATSRRRAEDALDAADLVPHLVRVVRPRPGRPPVYTILVADGQPGDAVEETLDMRNERGEPWSSAYEALRREMDLPVSR
jgi:tRNA1Val (adenine37-N6)-methyltransferase